MVPRILIVEDDPLFVTLIQRWHDDCSVIFHGTLELSVVSTIATARDEIAKGDVKAVLLDLGLPDSPDRAKTVELIKTLRSTWPPIIAISGSVEDSLRRTCHRNGAVDFIQKTLCASAPTQCIFERVWNAIIRREEGLP